MLGDLLHTSDEGVLTVNLGTVRYGQSYDIIVKTDSVANPVLNYEANGQQFMSQETGELENPNFEYHGLRLESIEVVKNSIDTKNIDTWNTFVAKIQPLIICEDEMVQGLLENLQDQANIALSNQ